MRIVFRKRIAPNMKMKFLVATMLMFIGVGAFGQGSLIQNANKLKPSKEFDNILVEPLNSDKHSSSYVIWVKDKVRLHKHAVHSEHVYVLKGKGEMRLGKKVVEVKKGDVIFIPEGTPHSVKVKGGTMKVISVQSPEFKGKDRIFLDN